MADLIDIDYYRKQKGTTGNFSIMFITIEGSSSAFKSEYIGTYETVDDLKEKLLNAKKITNTENYDSTVKKNLDLVGPNKNVILVNINSKNLFEQGLLTVIRIYARNQAEVDAIVSALV